MREVLYLFGGDGEQAVRLRKTLAPLRVMVRAVPPEQYLHSIGYLAGDKTCPSAQTPYEGEPFAQPLLLFAGFVSGRMDQVLSALRRGGLRIDYKAVLTPTNRTWTAPDLYREIAREHEQLSRS